MFDLDLFIKCLKDYDVKIVKNKNGEKGKICIDGKEIESAEDIFKIIELNGD